MGRRILAIFAAVVIALVGGLLVLLYARSADARAVEAQTPTPVYVSSLAVPAGTSLREAVRLEQLTKTQVPTESLPAGALTKVDPSNAALVALSDIPPGQYVLASAFGEVPLGEEAIQVPAGQLAVSVRLSDPARVGNFVRPGNRLTIFATHELAEGAAGEGEDSAGGEAAAGAATGNGTNVLLPDVLVIAMGDKPLTATTGQGTQDSTEEQEQEQQQESFLVTLAVPPAEATRLVHGINNFTLYAGLRGDEVKVPRSLSTDDESVFGGQ